MTEDGKYLGETTRIARQRLATVAERCVADGAAHVPSLGLVWRRELFFSKLGVGSVGVIVVMLMGYGLNVDRKATTLAMALLMLCSLLVGTLVKSVYRRCEALELRDRVLASLSAFVHNSEVAMDNPAESSNIPPSRHSRGQAVGLHQGNSLATVVPVYRDGLWQRIPKLLLVEGDVVALMGGDKAPASAELLSIDGDVLPIDMKVNLEGAHENQDLSIPMKGDDGGLKITQSELGASPKEGMAPTPASVSQPLIFKSQGSQVSGGECIQLRSVASEYFKKRMMVSATSPDLLFLCGDMRCYRLLETPLAVHLKHALSPDCPRAEPSLLCKRVKEAWAKGFHIILIMVSLAAILGGIRLALVEGSRDGWALFLLVIPSQVALSVLPISLPLYLAVGEAAGTARLLAFCELMLLRKRDRREAGEAHRSAANGYQGDVFDQFDADEREEIISGTTHRISWGRGRKYMTIVWKARWECGMQSRNVVQQSGPLTESDSALGDTSNREHGRAHALLSRMRQAVTLRIFSGVQGNSRVNAEQAVAEPDAREDKSSQGRKWHVSGINRPSTSVEEDEDVSAKLYKSRVMGLNNSLLKRTTASTPQLQDFSTNARAGDSNNASPTEAHKSGQVVGSGLQLLPVPLLGCGLIERLGAVTNLCMLDEDTVCQPTSAIEEVFLLDSKDENGRGGGTVLDMHTQQGREGVRFEDPQWWTHLAALKPIGLTCLLSETKRSEASNRPPALRAQGRGRSSYDGSSTATPSSRHQKNIRRRARALLDHIRDAQPMEHLADLWKGIGFCEADRSMFREKRRIHVIDPKLAAERVTADTHAQGQEESWRRGSIQPHVTSIVVQDKRTSSLQLLSQGHPSIVVGMCRDYWDGNTISTLPSALRKDILNMHQQWSLEDLDVVAFAYTPVPYTVTPFLSTFNKHPDYLVYSSHGSGRVRSRGGTLTDLFRSEGAVTTSDPHRRNSSMTSTTNIDGDEHNLRGAHTITRAHSTRSGIGSWSIPCDQVVHEGDERSMNGALGLKGGCTSDKSLKEESLGSYKPNTCQNSNTSQSLKEDVQIDTAPKLETRHGQEHAKNIKTITDKDKILKQQPGTQGIPRSASGDEPLGEGILIKSPSLPMVGPPDGMSKMHTRLLKQTMDSSLLGRRMDGDGSRWYSMDDSGVNVKHRPASLAIKEATMAASGENSMAQPLWSLMHDQVFVGMAASSVPPKREMDVLIEDLCAAGVRFVYFSPRNMRRSKALAENMGIETDWNCAISLRSLEDNTQPDPHRMMSTYADWDVKARLPHGIAAIQEHIEQVDNVPLLVSLFTDATPQTTKDMLSIYRSYHESVLAVGMSYRSMNGELFQTADLSLSVEGLPLNQPLSSLPVASPVCFSAIDAAFNSEIVGLHAALPLGDLVRSGGAMSSVDEVGSVLVGMLREGRRLLDNIYQALSFILMTSFTMALLLVLGVALPVSHPPTFAGDHILWMLWVVAPSLSISFLASAADGGLMRRTPEKNDPKVCLCNNLGAQWMDTLWCGALERSINNPPIVTRVREQTVDLVMTVMVLCIVVQSAGFMYRTATVWEGKPWKNWIWCNTVGIILFLEVVYLWASAAARGTMDLLLDCPWEALVAGGLCPIIVALVGESVRRNDARVHKRYITLLRLEFDTRLGMHSPK
ncbi:unnamed protein product [Choristocarpus tenellus]